MQTPADPAFDPATDRRWPVGASILVALAVATMIALGFWQLQRADEKGRLLSLYTANLGKPPTGFPVLGPVPDAALFRQSTAPCLEVVKWRVVGGTSTSGKSGFRQLAECRSGAEGPGFVADMGVTEDAQFSPHWSGGIVTGRLVNEPLDGGLLARLAGRVAVPRPMLVSVAAAPGLMPSAPPNPDTIPNNHLAYAVQWFLFALAALVIFVLAVRKRRRGG